MKVKYNRISSLSQTGNRFSADKDNYDLTLFEKISGSVKFRDRPKAKELINLIEQGKITEIVVEEFSRLGRSTGDVVNTLDWMDQQGVNVVIKNIGLQSRPNGVKNPIWKMISSVMSSLYEMELENIKERTMVGRMVYVTNGGVLGRPKGTQENQKDFLNKGKNKKIAELLNKGWSYRQISKQLDTSTATILKVKKEIKNDLIFNVTNRVATASINGISV
jgi:DNA invertase Pin-like site-specific DNA recombinase